MPKGVLWRQEDILRAALYTGDPGSLASIVERAKAGGIRSLPAPPFMHGAAHWVAFNMWHVGGTIVVQSQPRHLDPHDIWSTVEREKVNALTIVGDAFGRPLADQLRKRRYDLSSLKLLTSGGAILTAALKQEFLELLPERAHPRRARLLRERRAGDAVPRVGEPHQRPGDFALDARQRGAEGGSLGRCSRPAPPSRAGSRAAATCRSATTGTRRRPRRPSRWWTACATRCPATAPASTRRACCACSGATR